MPTHLTLTCGKEQLADDELIDKIDEYKRLVITGLAGSGKSMLSKYLMIRRFLNPSGRIPLFVELRHLNPLTSKNLLAYVHQSCASANSKITFDQFELTLRTGGLFLVLDGFDEIDYEHRDQISDQIMDISTKYPEIVLVVSGRPDNKFATWQSFYTFTIDPLSKTQALDLISKIDYDSDLKTRFQNEVKRRLYESHKSFLSSPLLASIMLLTYEQFAEIPNKIHIFYEQAFSALFRRHDAQKTQFIRKTYANLAIDDFNKFFATFCTFSYAEQRFSFSDQELIQSVKNSLSYARVKANPSDVIRDLYECVCMLQKDVNYTDFVHRSFQEYFCALFLVSYHGAQLPIMLIRFLGRRLHDRVLALFFEMARDRVDRDWALPFLTEILQDIFASSSDNERVEVYKRIFKGVNVTYTINSERKVKITYALAAAGADLWVNFWMCTLYGKSRDLSNLFSSFERAGKELMNSDEIQLATKEDNIDQVLIENGGKNKDIKPVNDSNWFFEISPNTQVGRLMIKALGDHLEMFRELKSTIEIEIENQESLVELLFKESGPDEIKIQPKRKRD